MNKYASQLDGKLIGFCPIEFGPFIAELQLIEEKLTFCQVSQPCVGNSLPRSHDWTQRIILDRMVAILSESGSYFLGVYGCKMRILSQKPLYPTCCKRGRAACPRRGRRLAAPPPGYSHLDHLPWLDYRPASPEYAEASHRRRHVILKIRRLRCMQETGGQLRVTFSNDSNAQY